MNRVRMTIIWSLSIVFFVSCESAGDKRLDFALEQAGKNRIELEKVLNYYLLYCNFPKSGHCFLLRE